MFDPTNTIRLSDDIGPVEAGEPAELTPLLRPDCQPPAQSFLPAEDIEEYFESVEKSSLELLEITAPASTFEEQNSPCFGRTTPLLYEEDGGASTDVMEFDDPLADCKSDADFCPDFQQLGIMATSTDENAITSLISSDEPQVTDADGDDNPAPSDPEPTKSAINDKLRRSIETRRKKSGLAEIKVEWKESEPEMRTELEKLRLERRRESNRRAAAKSRIKKREESENKKKFMNDLIAENKTLRRQLERCRAFLRHHLETCRDRESLRDVLRDVH
ncbi:hypothetical protein LSH36_1g22007 [Paralvinella palmiformis]|uniref:BZIP domain-containing protein n=1 Tax=Paralvinella palmiformis TaxID=53620 RepID=A0AAD9KGK8_9ANNE|nr:hypothetical protein LSH36_1g22007 [Paralvinella palmiformis]